MTDGRWVDLTLPTGTTRRDWVPDAQPAPPGDAAGSWHVVQDVAGAAPRWEWHPALVTGAAAAPAGTRRALPLPWAIGAGIAGVLVLAIALGTTFGGGSDGSPTVAVGGAAAGTDGSAPTVIRAPAADPEPRDVSAVTTDAAAPTPSPGSTPVGRESPAPAGTPASAPLTWQQQVALHPDAPLRLSPVASDWSVEQIVISHDLAGKFVGRVNVRYTGPGSATGRFEVTLLRGGQVVTTLAGSVPGEVRSGVYPVILYSTTDYVEGPWTTRFRVASTS